MPRLLSAFAVPPVAPRLARPLHRAHPCSTPRRARRRPRPLCNCTSSPSSASDPAASSPPPPRPIAVLPAAVIQRIAAGEVIHDYSTALSELLDNALDARAASIHAHIDAAERTLTVTDDGHGIVDAHSLILAATPNATSKLCSTDGLLAGPTTLGFRGQALAALATLARSLTVSSRAADAPHGLSASFEAAASPVAPPVPVPMTHGTSVLVDSLPFAVDRAADLRRTVALAALCHPTVSFRISVSRRGNGSSKWLLRASAERTHAGAGESRAVATRLAALVGLPPRVIRHATRVNTGVGSLTIALADPATATAPNRHWLVVAVNGRAARLPRVVSAVARAMSCPSGRTPVAFVHVWTEPRCIDANRAPDKRDVAFLHGLSEAAFAREAVALVGDLLAERVDRRDGHDNDYITDADTATLPTDAHDDAADTDMRAGDAETETETETGMADDVLERQSDSRRLNSLFTALLMDRPTDAAQGAKAGTDCDAATESAEEGRIDGLGDARVVAQVLQTYIIVEHGGGLVLVEQHVADERIIFERLRDSWARDAFEPLKRPIRVRTHDVDADGLFALTTLGFELAEPDAEDDAEDDECVEIASAPGVLARASHETAREIVRLLARGGGDVDKAAATVACRLAVRNGAALSTRRMTEIVGGLFACTNPHTCPHGRPVFRRVGAKQLAALFGRAYTPGGGDGAAGRRAVGVLPE